MNNSIRKYHFIFLWLMALFLPLQVCAQKGLNVNALFGGHYRKQREVTEVLMKGRQLESYKLTLFRSLTLPVATAHAARVETLVRADAKAAIDKEAALRGQHLYYGFYQLRPVGHTRRYLFYRNNSLRKDGARQSSVTLIYMEGQATLDELRRTFGKQR